MRAHWHTHLAELDPHRVRYMALVPVGGGGGAPNQSPVLDLPLWFPDSHVGTWTFAVNAGQIGNGVYSNTTGVAQNDQVTYSVPLVAGTYTIDLLVLTAPGGGIITVKDGATSLGTADCYSAGVVGNVARQITGAVVATTGNHSVQLLMATKNASSSNYTAYLTQVRFTRTGA